jgi:hypothetical protein
MTDEKLLQLFLRHLPADYGAGIHQLYNDGVISNSGIKKYLIRKEFEQRKSKGNLMMIYSDLALEYGYSIQHIRLLLK